jgi:hypothetical protein
LVIKAGTPVSGDMVLIPAGTFQMGSDISVKGTGGPTCLTCVFRRE